MLARGGVVAIADLQREISGCTRVAALLLSLICSEKLVLARGGVIAFADLQREIRYCLTRGTGLAFWLPGS